MKWTHMKEQTNRIQDRVQYTCGSVPIYASAAFLEKPTSYKKMYSKCFPLI
jgi:hypothetical protein